MTYERYYGLYPPAAEHIRPDYQVRPRQQTPSFSNSLVSSTSAQQSQRTPSFSNSLVSTSAQQSQQTPSFSNSLVSTSAQQSQHQRCTACIYLARNCSVSCWFAQFIPQDFWGDFETVCRTQFERRNLAYKTRTSRQELTGDEIIQIRATTTLFEREIRARSCPDYGSTGIVISLVNRLLAVNTSIDFLEEISADRVQQLVEQYHSRQVPRYPAPTNVNTGGPGQQQQQFQRGVAKRSLEQGGPPIPQQRPRLPGPPIPLQPPRLQQQAQFVLLHHPTPFQQPYPPAAFQQPSYHVQMQGYHGLPLLQSQLPAMPSQSEQLLAGINSSSTATSSQSLFQSQQQHYVSTGSSSSAAVVGQPDPHHQEPPDPYDFSTIQFTGDGENSGWDTEQERLAEEQKRLAEELKQLNEGPR
ncbi:hypothetical protein MKW92_023275 [Papaver armeniacum]|nr:hypothetical protein MKW92_023275 [Papaver armeniacum]